jgi:negative regulator of flagellin synthesis FlgM
VKGTAVKIENSLKSVGGAAAPETRARAGRGPSSAATTPSGAQVDLSPLAARLQEIGSSLASVPVVDSGRVAEIKQAIADGRFQVDARKVADGLIESVRQMLGSRTSGT